MWFSLIDRGTAYGITFLGTLLGMLYIILDQIWFDITDSKRFLDIFYNCDSYRSISWSYHRVIMITIKSSQPIQNETHANCFLIAADMSTNGLDGGKLTK